MQLSLFEDVDNRQNAVEYVVKRIIYADSIRNYIKQAIAENDRKELVRLFNESIRTFGFAHSDYWWTLGKLEDKKNNETYKITARELADVALKIRRD